jgi:tetratricopeptide (TPR) repeat protein
MRNLLFLLLYAVFPSGFAMAQTADALVYFKTGKEYYNAQNYETAKTYFTKAYNTEYNITNKYYTQALTYRGKCNRNLYEYEAAIKDFDGVIAVSKDYARVYRYRGYCKYLLERYDEAITDLNWYLYLAKTNEEEYEKGYYWRGLCYQNTDDHLNAISDFSKAIIWKTTYGEYGEARFARSKSYKLNGDYSLAVEDAFIAMENDETFMEEGLETVFYCFEMEKDLSTLYKDKMLNLINLYPTWTSTILISYGKKANAEEKYDKAIEIFSKAFETAQNDDEHYQACISIGGTYWLFLKDDDQAVSYYKKAKKYANELQVTGLTYIIDMLSKKDDHVKPTLTWNSLTETNMTTDERQILVNVCAYSTETITSVKLLINNSSARGQGVVAANTGCANGINQVVALQDGANTIQIQATNSAGTTTETHTITYHKPKPKLDKENSNPNAVVKTDTAQVEKKTETRIALVIGNSSYTKSPLKNAVNDANSMESVLKECGFEVVKITNADKKAIKTGIKEFSDKMKNYDVGLFFYAGHGLEIDGINYIVPTDVTDGMQRADVEEECVSTEWLQQRMAEAGSKDKTNIIILDACRSNPFRAWQRDLNAQEAWVTPKSVPTGVITCYAASQGETASDGENGNGLYTSTLLKYIKMPNTTIEQVFKKVRIELLNKKAQEPMESTKLTKDFYFIQPK